MNNSFVGTPVREQPCKFPSCPGVPQSLTGSAQTIRVALNVKLMSKCDAGAGGCNFGSQGADRGQKIHPVSSPRQPDGFAERHLRGAAIDVGEIV
jgi:hypothetical protein